MDQKEIYLFEQFKVMTGWMHDDSYGAMVKAQAHFLVAMGMFNYIETLGAFLTGYYKKENGQIKKNRKGKDLSTESTERFKAFLSYMGKKYENLSNLHSEMYKELRCGFSHEFLPSGRKFSVFWYNAPLNDEISENFAKCGITLEINDKGEEMWGIWLPKLLIDFRKAKDRLISEIAKGQDKNLLENFFETANKFNFDSFPI